MASQKNDSKKSEVSPKPEAVILPLEWYYPEGLVSRYVTNFLVQYGEHECGISFFEVRPPIVVGTPEENKAALEKLNAVKAECVSRIIISPARLPEFIQAMQTVADQYAGIKAEK